MTSKEKITKLYEATNNMLCHIGAEGDIDSEHPLVDAAMDALHEIDGGEYLTGLQQDIVITALFLPDEDPNQLKMFEE